MAIPGRTSAASILLSLAPPSWHLRHSRAVAEIAGWLAGRAAGRGLVVDRRLVEAAALLHDVDKLLQTTDPAAARPHGAGSAAWLARKGWPELGPAVEAHPVTRLFEETADDWLRRASLEELLVAYADKRAGQRLEPMTRRFASWEARYPTGWDPVTRKAARQRAGRLEALVCRRLDIEPGEVRRLPWTGAALRRAAKTGAAAA